MVVVVAAGWKWLWPSSADQNQGRQQVNADVRHKKAGEERVDGLIRDVSAPLREATEQVLQFVGERVLLVLFVGEEGLLFVNRGGKGGGGMTSQIH